MFANKLFINVLAITSLLEAITKGKMGFAEVKNWSGGGGTVVLNGGGGGGGGGSFKHCM